MSLQPGRNNVLDFTRLVIFVELDPGEFWRHWVKVIFELDLSNDFAPKKLEVATLARFRRLEAPSLGS